MDSSITKKELSPRGSFRVVKGGGGGGVWSVLSSSTCDFMCKKR